jgi:hypothetical protein
MTESGNNDHEFLVWFAKRLASGALIACAVLFLLTKLIDDAKEIDSFTLSLYLLIGVGLFAAGMWVMWRVFSRVLDARLGRGAIRDTWVDDDYVEEAPHSYRIAPEQLLPKPSNYTCDYFDDDGRRVTLSCDKRLVDQLVEIGWPKPSRTKWSGGNDGYTQATWFLASLPGDILQRDGNGWRWREGVTREQVERMLQGASDE